MKKMKYAKSLLEIIGNTPLVKLNNLAKGLQPTILLKLEFLNPGGSTKDRIGIAMITEAEKKGLLKKGGTIVEPTSGNTGVGLAMAAAVKGYKVIFTMSDKMSMEKENVLRSYGAQVFRAPADAAHTDARNYHNLAKQIAEKTPNSYLPDQYNNLANPEAHYSTTGPEIWRDTDGKITHFIAGIGTGGTITGTAKYLKEQNKDVTVIGVDTDGSILHSEFYNTHKREHPDKIEGIGSDFIPKALDMRYIDEIAVVEDKDAFLTARDMVKREGILAGGSSGAAVFAALRIVQKLSKSAIIVVILPDSGKNYMSKIYNDNWMRENNLL